MKKILGIELGSTRIKSVLIDESANVLATGIYEWENRLVNGLWSYPLEQAVEGLQESYGKLARNYEAATGEKLTFLDAAGISGMMHGYLALDADDCQLAEFRTWRNTHTAEAAAELSGLFNFNIPQRWTAAQYYQAILDGEEQARRVAKLFTLAAYIHYRLTGRFVAGIGEASGMFPVRDGDYDADMIAAFNKRLAGRGVNVDFKALLPKALPAGENAGFLTEEGAKLLDVTGSLRPGVPFCPPEGDMQTGMVCSDSTAPGCANVSAGTSSNIIITLSSPLKTHRPEIDVMMTPEGFPAAMVHSNNCTSEINEWVSLFGEVAALCGAEVSRGELFGLLFRKSLESDPDTGGLVEYNYLAGEAVAGCSTGALTLSRSPSGRLSLANLMQVQLYSALSALSLGIDLMAEEGAKITGITAAGGFYKTDFVGQNVTSAAFGVPVTLLDTAGEGGPWGMALLALYMLEKTGSLTDFLRQLLGGVQRSTVMASEEDIAKYRRYFERYRKALAAERAMAELLEN